MRRPTIAAALLSGIGLMFLGGCGSNIKEGVPDKIDMTQDFSPMAKPIGINPADSAKAEAVSGKNAAGTPGMPGAPDTP